MKKKAILLTMLAMIILFSCSRGEKTMTASSMDYVENVLFYEGQSVDRLSASRSPFRDASSAYGVAIEEIDLDYRYKDGNSSDSTILTEIERKLIKRANIRIRVDNLETADISVSELLRKYNGYAASTDADDFSHNYSLRVPSYLYDQFLTEMDGIGKLIRRSESTEDVTIRYYDLESQLNAKRELLRTFQSYLTRANTMEEILAVEYRIADLQREIEFTGTQLRNLADRVDYATIDLYLQGPAQTGIYQGETFGDRIKRLFGSFGEFLSSAAIFLLGFVIYGIPIIALVILLVWILFGRIGLLKKLWKFVMVKTPK